MSAKTYILFTIILLSQVLFLNHVHINGYGTPLLCILPILLIPYNTQRWITLLTGFGIGIFEDMFINTPGVCATTFTLLGLLQPVLLKRLTEQEDDENIRTMPSAQILGWWDFSKYVVSSVFIVCFVFFTLDYFTVFNFGKYLTSIISSTLLTSLMILAVEGVRKQMGRNE